VCDKNGVETGKAI